jgi:murein DD-endopeptidase MepM/ murein hydrolase activator NlpD
MRQNRSASTGQSVRPIRKSGHVIFRYRHLLLAAVLVVLLSGTAVTGFMVGQGNSAVAAPVNTAPAVNAFIDKIAEQENRCALVEQINLQDELAAARQQADALSEHLAQQQQEIQRVQEEMDTLHENIIKALMTNLTEKMVSRSSPTLTSYIQEAKNLIALRRKLTNFEKTPTAAEIDLTEYKAAINNRLSRIPTLKPISGSLDGYGYRTHPVFGYRHFHPAVDMGAKTGTPIKAAGAGTVIVATYNRYSGNYVKISHGNGFTTAYLHCSKLYVKVGDRVSKGSVIAAVGNTGTSTTPHLHFEIRFYDNPVNPRLIIME